MNPNHRPNLTAMNREELTHYARQGRVQDLDATREALRRHHLRMEKLGYERRPDNVVPFTCRDDEDSGGIA